MTKTILLLAILLAAVWVLWEKGLFTVKYGAALLFVGRRGPKMEGAQMTRCSRTLSHIVRLTGEAPCTLTLRAELTTGDIRVELHSREKRPALILTRDHPTGAVEPGRYRMVTVLKGATGDYELTWN